MAKLTLKQAHKDCKAIWKWLSKHSDENMTSDDNKKHAMMYLHIDKNKYEDYYYCPYCMYANNYIFNQKCNHCPIYKKYDVMCFYIGYDEWKKYHTKENAKKFYNKIKNL